MASPNKPKKEEKFKNFCRNTFKVADAGTVDKLWEAYQKTLTSA